MFKEDMVRLAQSSYREGSLDTLNDILDMSNSLFGEQLRCTKTQESKKLLLDVQLMLHSQITEKVVRLRSE